MWSVTADPERFDEAIEWFRKRLPVTDELLERFGPDLRSRAFRVAGVAELELLSTIYELLLEAIQNGTGVEDFRRAAREKIAEWTDADSHHVRTIFVNNVQHAYNAGRWRQLQDDAVVRHRPFLMFDAVLDSRTSVICQDRNGIVLAREDAFWDANHPPLHHRCRSSVRALTPRQAERRGVADAEKLAGLDPTQDGFGAVPREDDWRPDDSKYSPELWAVFSDKQSELLSREGE